MSQTPQTAFPSPGPYSQFSPQQGQYAPGQSPADFKPLPDTAALQQHHLQAGGYPQQQPQPGYGPPGGGYGYQVPSPSSGYPQTGSTSPGFPPQQYGQAGPYPGQLGQIPNELPVHYALGSEGHRAELGQSQR
jgi:hypothetical protein